MTAKDWQGLYVYVDAERIIVSFCLVTDFRPVLLNHAAPIPEQNLRENCQQWINT